MPRILDREEFDSRLLKAIGNAHRKIANELFIEVMNGFNNEYGYNESYDGDGLPSGKKISWDELGLTEESKKYVKRAFKSGGRGGKYHPILVRTGKLKKSIKLEIANDGLSWTIEAIGDRKKISEYNDNRPHTNEPGYFFKDGGKYKIAIQKAIRDEWEKMVEDFIIISDTR